LDREKSQWRAGIGFIFSGFGNIFGYETERFGIRRLRDAYVGLVEKLLWPMMNGKI
jgi:hypothetical protein